MSLHVNQIHWISYHTKYSEIWYCGFPWRPVTNLLSVTYRIYIISISPCLLLSFSRRKVMYKLSKIIHRTNSLFKMLTWCFYIHRRPGIFCFGGGILDLLEILMKTLIYIYTYIRIYNCKFGKCFAFTDLATIIFALHSARQYPGFCLNFTFFFFFLFTYVAYFTDNSISTKTCLRGTFKLAILHNRVILIIIKDILIEGIKLIRYS